MNTIIEKIRAEVNRLKPRIRKICGEEVKIPVEKVREKFDTLLSRLSDLEKEEKPFKEPIDGVLYAAACGIKNKRQIEKEEKSSEGLEKEIDKIWKTCEPVDEGMGVETANTHIEQFDYLARHFAKWGAERQKEQMMDEWLKDRDGCFWDGVEEGKKAMEKEAVEASVGRNFTGMQQISFTVYPEKYKDGDKVKIIIVKED